MGLLGNNRGIAIQDMQDMANHWYIWGSTWGKLLYREKEEVGEAALN